MTQDYGIENIDYLKPIPEEHVVSVNITSVESESTELETIPVTIIFSEPVSGFVIGDVVVSNATKANFSGSGKIYTLDVNPTEAGEVTIDIPADVAHTRVGYKNSAATQFSIEFIVP